MPHKALSDPVQLVPVHRTYPVKASPDEHFDLIVLYFIYSPYKLNNQLQITRSMRVTIPTRIVSPQK